MGFKDHFSKNAAEYAKFRPRYPREMFEYLANIAPARKTAWDCATGNGQAAVRLADVFDRVIATDASDNQIANAEAHDGVEYRVASAEDSGIETASIDLITVAQALHWFDFSRFYSEVNRVLKPNGVFAASAYRFFHITPAIDDLVNRRYYDEIVGPYWPAERALIMNFEQLPLPFPELKTPAFEMSLEWTLDHLLGYLRSWSATQQFIAANNRDPLNDLVEELRSAWGAPQQPREVVWSLTFRAAAKPA